MCMLGTETGPLQKEQLLLAPEPSLQPYYDPVFIFILIF